MRGRLAHFEHAADRRRDGELEADDAGSVIENAFDTQKIEDGIYNLEGVVSRKKQLIPEILAVLTQE